MADADPTSQAASPCPGSRFGLDPRTLLEVSAGCWLAHDGQACRYLVRRVPREKEP